MSKIAEFLGVTIYAMYGLTNTMIGCLVFYLAVTVFLLYRLVKEEIDNVIIGDYLKAEIGEINRKYTRSSDRSKKKVELTSKYHYVVFASPLCSLAETFFGIVFSLGCCSERMKAVSEGFLGINIWISPKDMLFGFMDNHMVAVGLLFLGLIAQAVNNSLSQEGLIVNQKKTDYLILLVMLLLGAFLPTGFVLFWALFEIIELVWLLIMIGPMRNRRLNSLISHVEMMERRSQKTRR